MFSNSKNPKYTTIPSINCNDMLALEAYPRPSPKKHTAKKQNKNRLQSYTIINISHLYGELHIQRLCLYSKFYLP